MVYSSVDRDKVPAEWTTRTRTETPCLHLGPILSQFSEEQGLLKGISCQFLVGRKRGEKVGEMRKEEEGRTGKIKFAK
jgi:hypothetical protein